MTDIEKRARELLAAEYRKSGHIALADMLGSENERAILLDRCALRAIIAALTPPEGYVLVPVDLLRVVAGCVYPVSTDLDPRGYAWSEAYLDQALPIIKAAMAAARQEVSS